MFGPDRSFHCGDRFELESPWQVSDSLTGRKWSPAPRPGYRRLSVDGLHVHGRHSGYSRRMEKRTRAIGDAAGAMIDDELKTAIAALHVRDRQLLVAEDSEAALDLMGTKFVLLSTLKCRRR